MSSLKVSEYDPNEAMFHQMQSDLEPSQESEDNFLAEPFRKKLDSALAAIPEPLRGFLDNLSNVYELDELDLVLDLAMREDWYAVDDEDHISHEAPRYSMLEIVTKSKCRMLPSEKRFQMFLDATPQEKIQLVAVGLDGYSHIYRPVRDLLGGKCQCKDENDKTTIILIGSIVEVKVSR